MHILYLHQYLCPPGGKSNNRSFELARNWINVGHQVSFISSKAEFPEGNSFLIPENWAPNLKAWMVNLQGIHCYILDVPYSHRMPFPERILSWMKFLRKGRRLSKKLDFQAFDLIYASSPPLTVGELGYKLSKAHKIPLVYETVDVWPDVPIAMGYKTRFIDRQLIERSKAYYRHAKAVICLSEGMKTLVEGHLGQQKHVHVVHNGTNTADFRPIEKKKAGEFTALYAGTIGIANGLDRLVKAAKWLHENAPGKVILRIVGGGNDALRVQKMVDQSELPNIQFRDWIPKNEMEKVINQADVGVVSFKAVPILETNSANKFYDYLAAGLPVVINYKGWQSDYLKEFNCGLSSKMGDEVSFAKNLLKLAKDKALRAEMAANARKLAVEKFDRQALAQKCLRIFESII